MSYIQEARREAAREAGLRACQRQVRDQRDQIGRVAALLEAASVPGRGDLATSSAVDALGSIIARLSEVQVELREMAGA